MKLSTFANEESRNSHHNLSVKCLKIIDKENEKILSGTIDNREMDHRFSPMVSGFHPKTLFSTKVVLFTFNVLGINKRVKI